MSDIERTNAIAVLLRNAAAKHGVVPYQQIHRLFVAGEPLGLRYQALEDAISLLSDCAALDYGCLMALDNGLPGDDFFRRYKRHRPKEFVAVMGYGSAGRSLSKKRVIVEAERARVFAHAAESLETSSLDDGIVAKTVFHSRPRGRSQLPPL
ncbi:hypothetical protein BSFA1_22550 [Burkholderia sp. SFA1]|nr:hypothetical protein BSFA1_22550 [Burkholderia sp. SFA1]